ncbi:hypothetical protein ACQ4M4_05910 [Leptolyngbya sp. AN02str]
MFLSGLPPEVVDLFLFAYLIRCYWHGVLQTLEKHTAYLALVLAIAIAPHTVSAMPLQCQRSILGRLKERV